MRVDVGDDDLAGAGALGDERAHDADRTGTGDQHVFADEIEGKCGVHGIAERIEDRGDLVRNIIRDRHDIVFRNADELAEGAGTVDADAERVAAEMAPARPAVAALAADDMAFAGDPLADMILGDGRTDLGDLAAEFMTDDHRHRNGLLRPLVPVPDMHVGAADGRFLHADQNVVRPDFRHRYILHPETDFRLRLDQRLHHVRHEITLPNLSNHTEFLARLRESRDRALDIRLRMRRRHLRADARLPLRHDREGEADHVDAFLQHQRRHVLRELRVAKHDRE